MLQDPDRGPGGVGDRPTPKGVVLSCGYYGRNSIGQWWLRRKGRLTEVRDPVMFPGVATSAVAGPTMSAESK